MHDSNSPHATHNLVACAALEQSAAQGSPEEEDLFIARGVLQLLATGKGNMLDDKLADAQDVLQSYDVMHTQGGLPKTPLMNFIHLLIKVMLRCSGFTVQSPTGCTIHWFYSLRLWLRTC